MYAYSQLGQLQVIYLSVQSLLGDFCDPIFKNKFDVIILLKQIPSKLWFVCLFCSFIYLIITYEHFWFCGHLENSFYILYYFQIPSKPWFVCFSVYLFITYEHFCSMDI